MLHRALTFTGRFTVLLHYLCSSNEVNCSQVGVALETSAAHIAYPVVQLSYACPRNAYRCEHH